MYLLLNCFCTMPVSEPEAVLQDKMSPFPKSCRCGVCTAHGSECVACCTKDRGPLQMKDLRPETHITTHCRETWTRHLQHAQIVAGLLCFYPGSANLICLVLGIWQHRTGTHVITMSHCYNDVGPKQVRCLHLQGQ